MKKIKLAATMATAGLMLALAQSASAVAATGGNTTTTNNGYRIHTFMNSATASNFVVTVGGNIEVLVVAGGGGGGSDMGGGGGAGGLIYSNAFAVVASNYTVTVGAGGAGAPAGASQVRGYNGTNSVFGPLIAIGGGGGASEYSNSNSPAGNGGSGGGSAGGSNPAKGTGTPGQGNDGGAGGGSYYPGGGGGAGGPGTNTPAHGGVGLAFSINGTSYYYAGGGGGSGYTGDGGNGGNGGGGGGAIGTTTGGSGINNGSPGGGGSRSSVANVPGGNAGANTGGGGGGGSHHNANNNGGNGGSGIVIVRYLLTTPEIDNRPATNVTAAAAWLNGCVVSTGGAPITAVAVYWGATDGGAPTSGLWTLTNTLSGGPWTDGDSVTWQATGLTANVTYYYRYHATNSFGEGWASSSEHFLAGDVTVTNTDPVATRNPSGATDTGTLTIKRDTAATNDALTVSYAWGGTAVQGVDYTPSPAGTSVTLAAGAASTNITITPLWGYGAKTVWLTLIPGAYAIGSPASNVVAIDDYIYTPGANVTTNAGNWNNGAIWSLGRRPMAGDDVTVKHAVLVSNATDYLSSFVITNATLTFTNWNSALQATNVTILNSGVMKLPAAFTNAPDVSNNIYVVCANLTIAANGSINADSGGYKGGYSTNGSSGTAYSTYGNGPGAGYSIYGGGGYGGRGGGGYGGTTNGAVSAPTGPGSGGGGGYYGSIYYGGSGGGAVRIFASGIVTVNGAITANGQSGSSGGSGSGGGIYISCNTLAGTNGAMSVNGGGAYGGGGGGRIAVIYDTNAQALIDIPAISFSAKPGLDNVSYGYGDVGTIYFPDNRFFVQPFRHTGQWCVPGSTNLALNNLIVSNGWLRFPADGFQLTVSNRLEVVGADIISNKLELTNGVVACSGDVIVNKAALILRGGSAMGFPSFNCGGNLILTNGGAMSCYSSPTNGASATAWGALLSVTNDIRIATNSFLYLYAQPTNGGAPLLRMQNLAIASGGTLSADGGGYVGNPAVVGYGNGPGKGNGSGGGGYGGFGGYAGGGQPYGDVSAPIAPGSSGGTANANYLIGTGGGVVRIEAAGMVTVNGVITASGTAGNSAQGCGSGGGIYIQCNTLAGTNGAVQAVGGSGGGAYGNGGGGRIAVIYDTSAQALVSVPSITFAAAPGGDAAYIGDIGTIYFPDNRFFVQPFRHTGQWCVPGFTNLALNDLLVSNAWLRFPTNGFQLTVSNRLEVAGANIATNKLELGTNGVVACGGDVVVNKAALKILGGSASGSPAFNCGGNLILTNGGAMSFYSGPTNGASATGWGALLAVTNDIRIATNSFLYLYAHPTNGGAPLLRMQNLTIASGGTISANGGGYMGRDQQRGYGPGAGNNYLAGGGYGGKGAGTLDDAGVTYGSSNAPVAPGSPGGAYNNGPGHPGCSGGGAVRIEAVGTIALNGTISADGASSSPIGNTSGGGSGGGIYLKCRTFAGNSGFVYARGGAPGYAKGGGGRIAIWRVIDSSAGITASAAAGDGTAGAGTVVWGLTLIPSGMVFKGF